MVNIGNSIVVFQPEPTINQNKKPALYSIFLPLTGQIFMYTAARFDPLNGEHSFIHSLFAHKHTQKIKCR